VSGPPRANILSARFPQHSLNLHGLPAGAPCRRNASLVQRLRDPRRARDPFRPDGVDHRQEVGGTGAGFARRPTRGDLALTALGVIFCTAVVTTLLVWAVWHSRGSLSRSFSRSRQSPLAARENRSREMTREFQREHPCPSTGLPSGACPGYRKDHVVPLACRGPDTVANLQWQTIRDARAKDSGSERCALASCPSTASYRSPTTTRS
jgi:hypothetical protein